MGLLDAVRDFLWAPPRPARRAASASAASAAAWEVLRAPAAPSVQGAAQITAIHACRALISGAIASIPVRVYRRLPNGGRAPDDNDDLWWVLNEEFAPAWSAAAAWEYLSDSVLLLGDAFAVIGRSAAGRPVLIEPVHPHLVEVRAVSGGRREYVVETPQGRRTLPQEDVLHIPGHGFDGLRSQSPLRAHLARAAAVAAATQEYAAAFFERGARPDYVLQLDTPVNEERLRQLREDLESLHAGPSNYRRPMVLQGGIKFQPITMPLEDVQLVALRSFQVEEIARAFGVPPFMIGYNEKTTSWGSGVEAMSVGFVRFTLRPWLNKIENELNRKLFRRGNRFVAFDTSDLERADLKSLFESFRIALGRAGEPGWLKPDEVRAQLNLPPLETGNDE